MLVSTKPVLGSNLGRNRRGSGDYQRSRIRDRALLDPAVTFWGTQRGGERPVVVPLEQPHGGCTARERFAKTGATLGPMRVLFATTAAVLLAALTAVSAGAAPARSAKLTGPEQKWVTPVLAVWNLMNDGLQKVSAQT